MEHFHSFRPAGHYGVPGCVRIALEGLWGYWLTYRKTTATPYQEALGASRHDGRSERQEGLPSHPPKRTNGADRHSAHSGTTQQGAQQPAATENLRETNVELREENPKTSPENLINTFLRGSLSALSFPKLPGDVKD